MLKIKPSTVYAWAERGDIPHFKLNGALRFSEEEIATWIQSNHKKLAAGYNTTTGKRPGKEEWR